MKRSHPLKVLKELTKRLVEKAMDAELTHHLVYEKQSTAGKIPATHVTVDLKSKNFSQGAIQLKY